MIWVTPLRTAFLLALLGTPVFAAEGTEWLEVPAQSLEIVEGSLLDFSAIRHSPSPSQKDPLDAPWAEKVAERPLRFHCAVLSNGPHITAEFANHHDSDALAVQLRRHGYNLVRFHNVDYRLIVGREKDFDIDLRRLDRFHYLLAALKRNGIFWSIDGMTQSNAGLAAEKVRQNSNESVKFRVNFDSAARLHWEKLVTIIYGSRNPYTGMTTFEDPNLLYVVPVNENGLGFTAVMAANALKSGRATSVFPEGLDVAFNAWLKTRFSTTAQLAAVIPELSMDEKLEDGNVRLPLSWDDRTPRMRLFLEAVSDLEIDAFRWMSEKIRSWGFRGTFIGHHEWYGTLNNRTRSRLPAIDVHAYVGELSSYEVGRTWPMKSGLERDVADLLINAGARWLDRSVMSTEYGQPFWNPFRYEAGIVFPAIAAMQNFEFACRHAHQSTEREIPDPRRPRKPIMPYSIGLDPVARAGETLAALVFYRGDLSALTRTVAVPFGEKEFARPGSGFLPREVRMAALLARFGIVHEKDVASLPPNALVVPLDGNTPVSRFEKAVARIAEAITGAPDERLEGLVRALRANGTLPPENVTDTRRGIFQSSSGEVTYSREEGSFAVVSPRTEAISFSNLASPRTLSKITISGASSGALVAASALDSHALSDSSRVLFIVASDAVNSGMRFADKARTKILDWGTLPILLKRTRIDIQFRSSLSGSASFLVLGLNGRELSRRPVKITPDGVVKLTLDTGAVEGNPTTFFALEFE